MRHAQINTQSMAQEVPMVTSINEATPKAMLDKLKKLKDEELKSTQLEIQNKQQKLTQLQSLAQIAPKPPIQPQDPIQQLEDQEKMEEQEVDEQKLLNMQQQMMQQNTQQMQQFNTQMSQMPRQAFKQAMSRPEVANIEIKLHKTAVICDVAATPKQQATGLQVYDALPRNRGLWFPMYARRTASFHMGDVKFPIDIIFIDTNKVAKIVSDVQPGQFGSWAAQCTDVVEVNAGWCSDNGIHVGCEVITPLIEKRGRSEIERLINTSWSAPQKARIKSETAQKSYDPLRTITEAETEPQTDPLIAQIEALLPELKKTAQENYKVKPVTYREQPGEIDARNPTDRFRHVDVPLISGGEDGTYYAPINPKDEGVTQYDKSHWDMQVGFDPTGNPETSVKQLTNIRDNKPLNEGAQVVRPASKQAQMPVSVKAPGPVNELAGVNPQKLAQSSIRLYTGHPPEWSDIEGGDPRGYNKIAVVDSEVISGWIDSLGFEDQHDAKLRQVMFTTAFKRLLGDSLASAGLVAEYDVLGSDLLLYRRE